MDFRWNEPKQEISFWDEETRHRDLVTKSDKQILITADRMHLEEVILAIARVVVELTEIEEKRNGSENAKRD